LYFAGDPFGDCHPAVALLSRQFTKIAAMVFLVVRRTANWWFLFVQVTSIGGYPKKLSRRIHGQ
jgi:hypothetical protein